MTRLVVTTDAEIDTSDILDYLEREASPRIAEEFGRRASVTRSKGLSLCRRRDRLDPHWDRTSA